MMRRSSIHSSAGAICGDTAHSPVASSDKTSSNSLYCFNLGCVGPVLLTHILVFFWFV